jgi:excisionase family DNA binding protein
MQYHTAQAIRMLLDADESVTMAERDRFLRCIEYSMPSKASGASKNKKAGKNAVRSLKAGAAAQYIGVSVRHLHDLASTGTIPYIKIGTRTILYDVTDLDHFLDSRKVGLKKPRLH